eukprot:gnl/TRDRNA2_/TRDRNA2_142962_c0_seq1.p1 gnl/TRDRNA2_/TRDRNA2_142962_c0~~gnl/TRDRNA2_/TRDRNA2_142962_c0_seq1.p1  ORF type:complete len:267 (+),score=32.22 gnl/TRDRNA2_/TRDRNA2_142962_c0_seq1:48-803(+)
MVVDGAYAVQKLGLAGLVRWPSAGTVTHTVVASFLQDSWGTVCCLLYTTIHLLVLCGLQDLTFLPFCSMDVFSEDPTLFDKSWPIVLPCYLPVHRPLSGWLQATTWQVEIGMPESYVFRSYVLTPTKGFRTGNEALARICSHRYIIIADPARVEKTPNLISGQAQLVNMMAAPEDETLIYGNVIISEALRNAVCSTVRILREGEPGDEWDSTTIEALLIRTVKVRDELSRCEFTPDILERFHATGRAQDIS